MLKIFLVKAIAAFSLGVLAGLTFYGCSKRVNAIEYNRPKMCELVAGGVVWRCKFGGDTCYLYYDKISCVGKGLLSLDESSL